MPSPPTHDLLQRVDALRALLQAAADRGLTQEEEQASAELTAALHTLLDDAPAAAAD